MTDLSDEQLRFMVLHARHMVVEWKWLMSGAQLLARTDRGLKAYISAGALGDLIVEGLAFQFPDCSRVDLTATGRERVK